MLTSARSTAHTRANAFVSLDEGLAVISRHAKSLGYDAVLLFLDELILWLLSRAADVSFVQTEGQKLAKLVEAQAANRPIPIVSFVARQRDLREAIGSHVPGAEHLSFADSLQWWEGRFHVINLEDRNLPMIVRERLLRPKSPTGRAEIDAAFQRTTQTRQEVMNILLTQGGNKQEFRDLYPFSPALVQILVAVSGALQRERTALRILLQILVNQREALELGQVVPVGDLWDAIVTGEEVFSASMRHLMDNARKLHREKLRPHFLAEAGLPTDWDGRTQLVTPGVEIRLKTFRTNDRLAKTLLLAALVPQVESLRNLDARRLAALNHGTITAPIPGQEPGIVLAKLKNWAAQVGEVRLSGDPTNPTVTVQLSGVDTESILGPARSEDNAGNRKRKIQELLFEALGIPREEKLFLQHTVKWRGTEHEVAILYHNVREANPESLKAPADGWKIIIDYPFDLPGFSTADDRAKLQDFLKLHPDGTRTLAWLPRFFTEAALKDLGDLVVIEFVLSANRFAGYASHLSAPDQQAAKAILESRQASLRQRMINALEAAYGLHNATPGMIDAEEMPFAEHFRSLLPGYTPQPPAAATLREGLGGLIEQALEHQFPGHPKFEVEVKIGALRRVYDYASKAIADKDGRVQVLGPHRPEMKGIGQALRLGSMGETHFVADPEWVAHFHKMKAADGVETLTVRALMDWMDRPQPCGLDAKVRGLVIKLFAELTHRTFQEYNGPCNPDFDRLEPEMELRDQKLPEESIWREAVRRAGGVFGITSTQLCNATTVGQLAAQVRNAARGRSEAVRRLVQALEGAHARSTRRATARTG